MQEEKVTKNIAPKNESLDFAAKKIRFVRIWDYLGVVSLKKLNETVF
jgi:hypothetical protein